MNMGMGDTTRYFFKRIELAQPFLKEVAKSEP
jgi:hypothetical protein